MKDRICSLLRMKPPIQLNRGLLFESGATVPTDGTDGYQTGCLFQHTDGGDNDAVYVNEGSVTSCAFVALGDLNTVDFSAGGTTAITISGTYTVEGISIENSCAHGIRVGAFTSGGLTTNAMVLDADNPTAVEVHGGLSSDPGSGTMARPLRSRLIVNTAGNVEAETYGAQGQLVVKSSNLGHWHGGVLGTIECQTALSVYNPLAGVGALVGRVGGSTITVQSSCYLASVIALASAVSLSNSGVYAGLYVTKTSGATSFSHGIYMDGTTVSCGIQIGVQDTGVPLTTAYPFGIEVHTEANADIVAGATGSSAGFYVRYAIETAQTSQTNHIAVFAKLRPKANMADGNHVAVYGLVEQSAGQITGASTTLTAAGFFALDISPTNITTGHLNGICIDSSVATGGTMSATMAAIRIKKSGSSLAWTTGITLEAAACTNGISLSVTTQACNMIVTALPANARGARFAFTCATPAMSDGSGAFEIDLTVTGTATGLIQAASAWVNLGTSAVIPSYLTVHNDGIWDGTATLTSAYISWAKYHCMLASNPAWCSLWELNFDGANSEVNSLFNVNNAELALGYQAGTPTKAAVGSIPFCSTAGGVLRYIYLYDAPDSD